ncbi:helix-turn-helix domain-containing protein [Aerosakkonema funiforme]|uniref:helix-turn-helix domain-containing protein n=1 Tax=Aerosakkonema funiforme TaxID=1246630 RepID=UPI0035B73B51
MNKHISLNAIIVFNANFSYTVINYALLTIMPKQKLSLESVIQPEEVDAIAKLQQILSWETSQIKLVGNNGEEVLIPESVSSMLRDIVKKIGSGQAIYLIPHNHEFTTQEAADILDVSKSFLNKLLDEEEIPYIKVGKQRRIRFQDLMKYKEQWDEKRSKFMDKAIKITNEIYGKD